MSKRMGYSLLGLFVVLLVVALIWVPKIEVFGLNQVLHPQKISRAFYKRDVFAQEDRARQTLATIVGGLLLLVSALLTWWNVRVAEKNAAIARRNVEIAQDKQITDRFTAAVTNLAADGPEKMAVRLGGIYALERIARDSPDDHWTVMEVLTAYVRDKCPKPNLYEREVHEISTDIQAILTVIGRRKADQDGDNKLNLSEVALNKANLAGANLVKANLAESELREANLEGTKLQEAILVKAKLEGAILTSAELQGAYLMDAKLQAANLWNTYLEASHLQRANLERANLNVAHLNGAELKDIVLTNATSLTQKQLNSADQSHPPKSLPLGLTFPGYVPPVAAPAAPAPVPPPSDPPAPPV